MKRYMDIHIFTEYFGLINSTGKIWESLADSLCCDAKIRVVTKGYESRAYKDKNYIVHSFGKHKINQSFIKKALSQIWTAFKMLHALSRTLRHKPIVLMGTNPSIFFILAVLLKRFRNFKLVVLVHDVFPENLIASGIINENHFLYRGLKVLMDYAYASADKLIVVGRDMEQVVSEKRGSCVGVFRSANFLDKPTFERIKELSLNKHLNDANIEAPTLVTFLGNLGRLQGIPELIEVLSLVKNKNVKFEFRGSGSEKNLIKNVESTSDSSVLSYEGEVSLADNDQALIRGDISLVTLKPGMYGLGVPSKIQYELAAGKPILGIGDKGSELEMIIKDHQVGWFIPWGDYKLMAGRLDFILIEYQKNGFDEKISWKTVEDNFLTMNVLSKLKPFIMEI